MQIWKYLQPVNLVGAMLISLGFMGHIQLLHADETDMITAAITSDTQHMIVRETVADGRLPVPLMLAINQVTSKLDANHAESPRIGIMQLNPVVVEVQFGVSEAALADPLINIRSAVSYVSRLNYTHSGNWDLILSEYFGGPLDIKDGLAQPHEATSDKVKAVYKWWSRYDRICPYWDSGTFSACSSSSEGRETVAQKQGESRFESKPRNRAIPSWRFQ